MDYVTGETFIIDKPLRWTSFDVVKRLRAEITRRTGLRKVKVGHAGTLDPLATGLMIVVTGRRTKLIETLQSGVKEYMATLALGMTPLPTYINRKPEPSDAERYQTIYARREGAVVAPAAGLHFSRELLKRLEIKGVRQEYLTIHSGLGNYREIDVGDLTKHRMDSEEIEVTQQLVDVVNQAKDEGHRICAVGTSVLRGIATAVSMGGHMKTYAGWTNKFIFPPYDFTVTDALVTNFHLPYSTMLMMACAFGGYDLVMEAYRKAIAENYRFGVYGDAMLII